MNFREELDKRNIKYERKIINDSDNYFFNNGVRVHIYKKSIIYCDNKGLFSFPPNKKSIESVLELLEKSL